MENKVLNKKIKNLKKLGFKETQLNEVINFYSNNDYNPNDIGIKKLYNLSVKLWKKYYNINYKIALKPTILNYITGYIKKKIILSKIFPIGGIKCICANNVFGLIGSVDLKGVVFINDGVRFSDVNVIVNNGTQIAPNVKLGSNTNFYKYLNILNKKRKYNLIKSYNITHIKPLKLTKRSGKITIGKDCWICASCEISNNVSICDSVVCAIGSKVTKSINKSGVYINNKYIKKCIDKSNYYKTIKRYNEIDINEYISEFVKSNIKLNKEFIKYVKGMPYNNIKLSKLYLKTHNLVCEFNSNKTTEERRNEILDILFIHSSNIKVTPPIYVDLLKTVKIHENVTIKPGCYLGGVIEIYSDVIIDEGVTIFSTGHSLNKKLRKTHFDLKRGIINGGRSDKTIITNGKTISKNEVIGPNKTI